MLKYYMGPKHLLSMNTDLKGIFGNLKVWHISIIEICTLQPLKKKLNVTLSWYGPIVYKISSREAKNVFGTVCKTEAKISSFACQSCDYTY